MNGLAFSDPVQVIPALNSILAAGWEWCGVRFVHLFGVPFDDYLLLNCSTVKGETVYGQKSKDLAEVRI